MILKTIDNTVAVEQVNKELSYKDNSLIQMQICFVKDYFIENTLKKKQNCILQDIDYNAVVCNGDMYFFEIEYSKITQDYIDKKVSGLDICEIFIVKFVKSKSIIVKKHTQKQDFDIKENKNRISVNCFIDSKIKSKLERKKIYFIDEIDNNIYNNVLEKKDRCQLNSIKNNQIYINDIELQKFIKKIKYPLCIIDFECYHNVLETIENLKDYTPFLYSLIKTDENFDEIYKSSYIIGKNKCKSDNSLDFAVNLIKELKDCDSILVYDKSLETKVILDLKKNNPHLGDELDIILSKIIDLQIIFKSVYYYNPKQMSKINLKFISDMVSQQNYDELYVKNGQDASFLYYLIKHNSKFIKENFTKYYEQELIKYCTQDVLSTYNILKKIKEEII